MADHKLPNEHTAALPGTPAYSGGVRIRGWTLASVLAALMLTLLLAALDQTIVSTALPTIIGDLHGFDRYTWVVTAYLVTETTVIPLVGKLSDQFGRKWFLVAGVVIFLIGSALSGTSQTMNALILFRGLQGVGAGFFFALVFTLVGDIFTPAERARWQGLFSAVFALASVVGPTLGGWITDNASWRWIFYVNLPLGAVALLLIIFRLPSNISVRTTTHTGRAALRRIDVLGALTAACGTVCLLLGLTWGGQTYPWGSAQVIGILVAAVLLFVAFFVAERFAVEPILSLGLFKNQVFASGALLSFTVGMALYAVVIYLPLFIQGVLGQTATSSGAVLTPLMLTMAAGSALIGMLIARLGRYQVLSVLGALILAVGVYLLTQLSVSSGLAEVTRDMIVVGVGMGMLQPVLTLAVQNAIPRHQLGVGTSAVTYLRTTGQVLGVAIIGSIVNNQFTVELSKRLPTGAHRLPASVLSAATSQQALINPQLQHGIVQGVTKAAIAQASSAVPPGPQHDQTVATITAQIPAQVQALLGQIFEATREALAIGIQHAFYAGLILCGVIIVITLFLKDVPLAKHSRAPGAPAGPESSDAYDRTRELAGVTQAADVNDHHRAANGQPQQPTTPTVESGKGWASETEQEKLP